MEWNGMVSTKDLVCCYSEFYFGFLGFVIIWGFLLLVVPTQRSQHVGWLVTSSSKWFRYSHGS